MANVDPEVYGRLDVPTLSNVLLDPDAGFEAHRASLTALSNRGPLERNPRLVDILSAIMRNPTRWQPEIPEAIIDLFATDPDAEATAAMLQVLPVMLSEEHSTTTTGSLSMIRRYFYEALASREREGDLEVWGEFLPKTDARMLVNLILDPQAAPLVEAIDPYELLNRTREPVRTNAVFAVIVGASRRGGITLEVRNAWDLLRQGAHRQAYEDGIDTLAEQWQHARSTGRMQHARGLEAVLGVMDKRPRSPADRLTGKRPWAP